MKRSLSRLRSVKVGCALLLLASGASCQSPSAGKSSQRDRYAVQLLLAGDATRIKYPLGLASDVRETGENFLAMREQYYILPRAYPKTELDVRSRFLAYQQLQRMRIDQRLRHISTGWLDNAQSPGGTGPGGCAWFTIGPANINGRVTNIAIDPNNNQKVYV